MKTSDPKKLRKDDIKNIIFDWGGVITNLDFEIIDKAFQDLGINNVVKMFSNDKNNSLPLDFEMGKVSPENFRNEIRKLSKKELSDTDIDAAWNSLLRETPTERIKILKKLGKNYRIFLLSNTNIVHANYYNKKLQKDHQTDHSILFEKAYYSHEIGIRKPNVEIFQFVLNEQGLKPEETLFIDDTEMHVDAAAKAGIIAFHLNSGLDIVSLFKDW